jgi:hypothetical protein
MFFHISKTKQDNFPYNHKTNNFIVSLDEGWNHTTDEHHNNIWFKGYLDDAILADHVIHISQEEEPKHSGNFCIIKVFDTGLIVRTDRLRSFPLWYHSEIGLTNLQNIGETYWTDSYIMLNNDLSIIHSKYDVVGTIDDSLLTLDQVIEEVDNILDRKIKLFLDQQSLPIRIFLSGGIDTALIFSYVEKHTNNYKLITGCYTEFDYFYLKNHGKLKNLWGYTQIHHWSESCILASGAPGDEFTARNPLTANLLLKSHNLSIPVLLSNPKYKNCLHYSYYNQQKYFDLWSTQKDTYSLKDTIKICCDYNVNDWQHWHLGKTLTWTPLRDIEVFKLFARLNPNDLSDQVMNSVIQLKLIEKNNPKILEYLSPQKNSGDYLQNLTRLYCQ